jgi:endogenous inhibitor of DNA gyrase (YacG/DUF329 family)
MICPVCGSEHERRSPFCSDRCSATHRKRKQREREAAVASDDAALTELANACWRAARDARTSDGRWDALAALIVAAADPEGALRLMEAE